LSFALLPGLVMADDLKAFPPAGAGMQRHVIRVPAVDAPDERKVEVMVGKRLEVDCNRQRLSAQVERKVAQGWGYHYYEVSKLSGPVSTLMACPPGEARTEAFVQAATEELSALRYNPRLPIVVYVPEGTEVRYRIWSAGPVQHQGKPE
jgi:ecotin